MKSFLVSSFLFAFVTLFFQATPLLAQTDAAPAKMKKIPFHGKIVAMDAAAGTVTLNGKAGRTLHITPATVLIDGSGNPTTLSTAKVGEDVGGSYTKDAAGLLTAAKLRIGAKAGSKTAEAEESTTAPAAPSAPPPPAPAAPAPAPAPAAAPAPPAPAPAMAEAAPAANEKKTRFSGKVTAVDPAAGTLTIKARAFVVTSTSKVMDATGAATTLASVMPGAKVSGTYEKSPDGKMMVESLKISK